MICNKLQTVSELLVQHFQIQLLYRFQSISGSSGGDGHSAATASVAVTSFDIPLTGSMSAGFTIGL